MQTTLAQQLIIFSFTSTIFMLSLVGFIFGLSILRLMRLQRVELAYIQANRLPTSSPAEGSKPVYRSPYASRDTRPRRPQVNLTPTSQIDIQITAANVPVGDANYKPRPIANRSEKIS